MPTTVCTRKLSTIIPEAMPYDAFVEEYLELTRSRRTGSLPYFIDKGLRNFGYAGLIHLVLPNARIIDVRRHPLDCGWSCFRSHFPGGQPFAHRLGDIGQVYSEYVRLMTHFEKLLP